MKQSRVSPKKRKESKKRNEPDTEQKKLKRKKGSGQIRRKRGTKNDVRYQDRTEMTLDCG